MAIIMVNNDAKSDFNTIMIVTSKQSTKNMVEDISANKPRTEATRPKPVYKWTEADVQKWLHRHCSDYCQLYWERFQEHAITGRALVRINDNTLIRMGIGNREHREAIWREILKLRLKADILEIIDLGRPHDCHPICDISTPGNVAISH